MITIPGRIPITIHPVFWIVAAIIGWFNGGSLLGMFVWILIILFSVIVHEMGHATIAVLCKQNPKIDLVAMGGVTSYQGTNLPFWQQFLIVLTGPIFGLLLFFVCYGLLALNYFTNPIVIQILTLTKIVNLFWTIVNLLPVLPLDGGQLLRIAMEAWLGVKGVKISLMIGMIIAFSISIFFIAMGAFLIGAIFFLFAFQAFDLWRRSKNLSKEDRDENNAKILKEGEIALEQGETQKAKQQFSHIREKLHGGVIYVAATHYLALIEYEEGKAHEAYEMLVSIKDQLAQETLCLLQQLAFEEKNYSLVADLSSKCFQLTPTQDVALRNAKAFAYLKKAKPAGGWLRKAMEFGRLDLEIVLSDQIFDAIRDDTLFKNFFRN